ncbi:MAG: DNA polymerase III subunit delta [candidate division KSB1 bacterium]|nr:DNA polymerase III subunit delta [candidate division KSB1 bacterium]
MKPNALDKYKSAADLPPVFFLAGPEEFLVEFYIRRIIDMAVPPDLRDFNLDVFHAADVQVGRILELARAFPMMAERRVVVVKEVQKLSVPDLKALVDYCKSPNLGACLVLTSSDTGRPKQALAQIQKVAEVLPCKPVYENQIGAWIEYEVTDRGYRIEPEAVQLLSMQVGTKLRELSNELDKIILYIGERKEITSADVSAVAGVGKEYSIFALQNALGEKKLRLALQIYRKIKIHVPVQVVISQLARFFHNVLIAYGYRPGQAQDRELAAATGVSPYFVRDLHKFKRHYTVQEIENALENLRQVDYSLKNYRVQDDVLMEQLLIQIIKGYPSAYLPFAEKIQVT